ncbi:DinB family protein [Brachybacterium sp. GCM10030267]|uniref:DinB family protein n=1 Tax=unclassified Brachybacterium TaxID=2623841 RepID=UPI0036168A62
MSPSHRGEPVEPAGTPSAPMAPEPSVPDASVGPVTDDPDGSAPAPPDSDELDVLVDRLAAEQALSADEEAPAAVAEGERPEPPLIAGEVETLAGFLDFLRATIVWKVEGLSDEQASARLVGSDTTVTGMIRHLADTERSWFREVLGGVPADEAGYAWSRGHDAEQEWSLEDGASLEEALADYRAATEASRAQLAGREPDEELRGTREARTVRWVLAHMVEETARHAGQLDILTELLDGRTGE